MLDRSIIEFTKNLELASKSLRMYSESHPRSRVVIQETYDTILKLLENRENVTLSVLHENILCDGEIVEKGSLVLTRLARELAARNIDTLRIARGVTLDEFLLLLRHLNLTPQQLRDAGGIEKVLDDQKIQTIQINKVKYGIIDGDTAGSFDQATLTELLLVVQNLLSGTAGVKEVAANIEQSLATNAGVDPGAVLLRLFQTMVPQGPEVPDTNAEPLKQKFTELFATFSPAMQAKLLLTSILSEKQDNAFYTQLNPAEFERAILLLLDQSLPEKQRTDLVTRLMHEEGIHLSNEVLEKIKAKALLHIEEEAPPHSIAADLLKKQVLTNADLEKIPDAIHELIEKGSLSEADQLSKRVFSLLTTGQLEQKKAAIEVLPAAIRSLSAHEKWKNVEFSLSFLIGTCYRKEASEDVLRAYIPYLLSIFKKHYDAKNWSSCQDALTTIRAQTERHDSVKQEFANHWINSAHNFIEHLREGWPGIDVIVDGLKIAGPAGLSYLIDLLADEEDQKVRSRLISAIVSFSNDIVSAEVEKRMNDPRWFVVRNMVTVASKLHSTELPAYLQTAAVHPDPRVPKELIKILYKGTSKSQLPFILLLMQHPDKNIRIQAVHLVTMQSNTGAIPALLKIVESSVPAETDLRTATFQALLKLRSLEGLVPAATLLDRKPSSKVEIAERNAAVRLLGELAREQMRTILEKTAQSDPHPETRTIAASYL